VRVSRSTSIVAAALVVVMLTALAALVGSSSSRASTKASKAKFLVTLVSDIGKFNDRSFNQSQKEGLDRARAKQNVATKALQSNSPSDYIPNLTQGVRFKSNLVISAGFLLAGDTNTVAKKYPKIKFAITDYDVKGDPFKGRKNVMGLTYAANEGGCLVGYLAGLMAKRQGGKQVVGAVGGLKIPPVDIWIAGFRQCAKLANKGVTVLIDYSQDFVAADKCKTIAENMISQGAKVLFQVAGGCGLGTLKAAAAAGIWGIGVDKDQYRDAKRVLTSGVKRVDNGVFQAIAKAKSGKFVAGGNLLFNLKNGGMSVGKINPAVPKKFITQMNALKQRIIKRTYRVKTKL
jgi:basic membrane protein A and related proteins